MKLKLCLVLMVLVLTAPSLVAQENWISLFDGKSLGSWEDAKNFGAGPISIKDGAIRLKAGSMSTSIRYRKDARPMPTTNYEIEYVAERTEGNDFFAALTFPVGKSFCTFVNGGWGGGIVGLSSLDGMDASENSSSTFFEFKNNVRYRFRVAVTDKSILCWIDDQRLVATVTEHSEISIRLEMELCKPLGLATWCSGSAIHGIRYRLLTDKEVKANNEAAVKNEFKFK
ncbi:MAG: DUF1080 domain-containing protein [Thermoguttaceae bacterium]|nr:DUF1080 domain-containing protein [Thermoguttaceae bacterium]